MAMGIVGYSGRVRSEVAPNSPSEIVNAKAAAESVARRMIGQSIAHQDRNGEAPSEAAA